jgi:transcription elongation factor Elf1
MNITKTTTSFTCPHCGQKSTYDLAPQELADGGKLVCGKCGKEIPFDKRVFEAIIGGLPTTNFFSTTTFTKSSMTFQCPRCRKTTTTDMTIDRLVDGEKVFCSHCGKEIPADGARILQADAALRGIAAPPGGGETKTSNTPGGQVVFKTKTSSVNVKANLDFGKRADPGAGGSAGGAPILTPRRVIEPKRGCVGVIGIAGALLVVALMLWFLG